MTFRKLEPINGVQCHLFFDTDPETGRPRHAITADYKNGMIMWPADCRLRSESLAIKLAGEFIEQLNRIGIFGERLS